MIQQSWALAKIKKRIKQSIITPVDLHRKTNNNKKIQIMPIMLMALVFGTLLVLTKKRAIPVVVVEKIITKTIINLLQPITIIVQSKIRVNKITRKNK